MRGYAIMAGISAGVVLLDKAITATVRYFRNDDPGSVASDVTSGKGKSGKAGNGKPAKEDK